MKKKRRMRAAPVEEGDALHIAAMRLRQAAGRYSAMLLLAAPLRREMAALDDLYEAAREYARLHASECR